MVKKICWILEANEVLRGRNLRTSPSAQTKLSLKAQEFVEESFRLGYIQEEKLSAILFPQAKSTGKRRIFISHPHEYAQEARAIKELLCPAYKCFVDEDVWGQVDVILQQIQKKKDKLNFSECNSWAAHMYLMLSRAILKEIRRSDIFLYLSAEDSTNIDIIHSPWIYFELQTVQLFNSCQDISLIENFSRQTSYPRMDYDISRLTKNFLPISYDLLQQLSIGEIGEDEVESYAAVDAGVKNYE